MERRLTTQDISWFLDLYRNEQLNLTPPYQRRSVWTRKDRVFFLDTVFKGYPCPAIFLHKEIDGETGETTYHVVDGKQRLETIILFAQSRLSLPKDYSDESLRGKKFKDLSPEQKKTFWNFVIGVDQLDIIEESVVDEVFDRLNRNSRKLERQELRHAKYDGWFINYAEKESEEKPWKDLGIATTARAKRMKDVQFISELMVALISGNCVGFSQDLLDDFCANYDTPSEDRPDFVTEDFEQEFSGIRDFLDSCESFNNCISSYARNFMHFYTLWCIAGDFYKQLSVEKFAGLYEEFMSQYKVKVESENFDGLIGEYMLNATGANTELPQRQARENALKQWINENI